MLKTVKEYSNHFLGILFPNLCTSCSKNLVGNEDVLCTYCEVKLPITSYHTLRENPVEKNFFGRTQVEAASAFLFFEKGTGVQSLLQQLKYKGKQEIGRKLGQLYGIQLKESKNPFKEADYILPIPLHPKKERIRGYNQCDSFVKAISEELNIPWSNRILQRTKHNVTQTGKTREERWKNVDGIFKVNKSEALKDKHVIVVDDVITTGATMEACIQEILKIKNTKVSVLTIAYKN